jgi:hypothetical protein
VRPRHEAQSDSGGYEACILCIHLQVLPSLRDKKDEKLLRELHRRWDNHNVMTRWLSRFFNYLDRCELVSSCCLVLAL